MKPKKKNPGCLVPCLFIAVVAIILAIGGGLVAYSWYISATTKPASDSTEEVAFKVSDGDTLLTLAKSLETNGLIKSELALRVYLRLNNSAPEIKAGSYSLPKNLTLPQLIDTLEKGVQKKTIWVTLREGLWNDQVADILDAKFNDVGSIKKFSPNEFNSIAENPESHTFSPDVQTFLNKYKPAGNTLIGFLYPDTYNFDGDATAQQVIEVLISTLMQKLKDNNLDPEKITQSTNISGFYDVLTLASIIEKESGQNDDKALIASVFVNRLDNYMYLQSDATLSYVTRSTDPRASLQDLQIDSPYNSYKNPGLPPTPISNPGIASIKAAFNPASTDYLFFRHDHEANIYFSKTYEEHLINIQEHP